MRLICGVALLMLFQVPNRYHPRPEQLLYDHSPYLGPLAYKDPKTGTLLYVESDGVHMAAISPDGKILWHRDPFKGSAFSPYRLSNPRITSIRPETDGSVVVRRSNSQVGLLSILTGTFYPMYQD
jgi:hypothetical protein